MFDHVEDFDFVLRICAWLKFELIISYNVEEQVMYGLALLEIKKKKRVDATCTKYLSICKREK